MRFDYNTICFEEKNKIGYLIIDDPPANKMTRLFFQEFNLLFRKHIVGSKVEGIIITGNGRHYSSGADIDQLKELVVSRTRVDERGEVISYPLWFIENRTTFDCFYNLSIPVISSIRGICIGSGAELALCSHIRIAAEGSILGLPESTFGFLPGACGTIRALEVLGLGKALELVLSGETFFAEEALQMGFVDRIVDKKKTLLYCESLLQFIIKQKESYSKKKVRYYLAEFDKIFNK